MTQRSRELIAGQVTLDYFARKAADGWTLTAVEWVREVADDTETKEPISRVVAPEELAYGLRIAEDGFHVESDPVEKTILLLILEKVVKEKRITQIANELNLSGFHTRSGGAWTPSAVFELMPRLIEMGPNLLKSHEWQELRAGATNASSAQ